MRSSLGVLVAIFVASRDCRGCFGGEATWASLEHSLVRYLVGAYLLFGIAALLLIDRARWPRLQRWASPLWFALVLFGGLWLVAGVGEQRRFLADESAEQASLSAALPEGTVLYSQYGGWASALDPSLVAARLPPAFARDPQEPSEASPPVVPAAEYERLLSSMTVPARPGTPSPCARLTPRTR